MEDMKDAFITGIDVKKVRNIRDLKISLDENERKNLIITGKNGCGKTSLLEAMRAFVIQQTREGFSNDPQSLNNPNLQKERDKLYGEQNLHLSDDNLSLQYNIPIAESRQVHQVVFAYVPADRRMGLAVSNAIEKTEIKGQTLITTDIGQSFLKYMIHLNYQLLAAQNDDDKQRLEKWFSNFRKALKEIYNCQELEFLHDAKELTFKIAMPGFEPFGLNEMADGYSAFLNIVIELLMRMDDSNAVVIYERPAIVFIDEIETHLHVELQKRILPFLTRLFPNVQFIVSTHSPFVITSLENAVVFDLEKRERLDNPMVYSYETIVESYLDTDMYSEKMKNTFMRYKELCFKERNQEENREFLKAKSELELVPPAAKELYYAFRDCEAERKAAKNDKNR